MSTDLKAEGTVVVTLATRTLPIPYPATGPRPDGENFGYRSIRSDPAVIDEIPELFGEPALKEFVRAINAPNGDFETVRIAQGMIEESGGFAHRVSLGLIYRDVDAFADLGNYMVLVGNVLLSLRQASADARAEGTAWAAAPRIGSIEISPAARLEEQASGWIADVHFQGIGDSEPQAKADLQRTIDLLGSALGLPDWG